MTEHSNDVLNCTKTNLQQDHHIASSDDELQFENDPEAENETNNMSYHLDGQLHGSDLDEKDLFILVTKPEKQITTLETFITYKIQTKTTRSSFDNCEYEVSRRYQDFIWLRSRLEEDHPTHLIPPLPEKLIMKGMIDRFSPEFTETRRKALCTFMSRISDHPVLSCNQNLKIFLISDEDDFLSVKKQKEGFLFRVSGSVKSMTHAASVRPKVRDAEFDKVYEMVDVFGEKLATIFRVAERLSTEKRDFAENLKIYAPTYKEWGPCEDTNLTPLLNSLSSSLHSFADYSKEISASHDKDFIPHLREYMLYADAVKHVFRKRDVYQAINDKNLEDLDKKKDELNNLKKSDQSYSLGAIMGRSSSDVLEQKEQKLKSQVDEISSKMEQSSDELEVANTNLRADLDWWSSHKINDIASIFSDYASQQCIFFENCLSTWEGLLPLLQDNN